MKLSTKLTGLLAALAVLVLFLPACGGGADDGGSSPTTKNLPSDYRVNIPKSIQSTSSPGRPSILKTSKAIRTDLSKRSRALFTKSYSMGTSVAYEALVIIVDALKAEIRFLDMYVLIADNLFDLVDLSGTPVDIELFFTEDMYAYMNGVYADEPAMATEYGSYYEEEIGQTWTIPNVTLAYYANPSDGYNYVMKFGIYDPFDWYGEIGYQGTNVIKWDINKTKLYHAIATSDSFGYEDFWSVSFDTTTSQMKTKSSAKFGDDQFSLTCTFQQKGANNGIVLDSTEKYVMPGMTNIIDFVAKADDYGGYVREDLTEIYDGSTTTYWFKETFDGNGTLTGQTWDIGFGEESWGDMNETYYDPTGEEYNIDTLSVTISSPDFTGSEPFVFVITADGLDPEIYWDSIIGSGFYDGPTSDDYTVDYWGTSGQISGASIWMEYYDVNWNLIYYELTATIN